MTREKFKLLSAIVLASVLAGSAIARPIRIDAQGNPVASTAASFDCAKAQGYAETAICSDGPLAMVDRMIDEVYQRLWLHSKPADRSALRENQRQWLSVRNSCKQRQCLANLLDSREFKLQSQVAELDRQLRLHVSQVGQCEETKIDEIAPRLTPVEGEPLDGTSVGYANGVYQVSYEREPEVLKSRIGDPVRVCLVAIPKGCPQGDDRGREYVARNLRTNRQWKLPDSSHKCGGA